MGRPNSFYLSTLVPLLALLLILPIFTHAQLTPSPLYSPPNATAGTVPSTSTPNTQWSDVLGNSLWFYDAQRSGNLSKGTYGNRVAWRNDSCLSDGSDYGLDLSGGWYDAGDYIKATFPLGFTMFAQAWGPLSYGPGFSMANQTAYLDGTLRWGFDWLIKAHPQDDVLFVEVGSTSVDNVYWGGDLNIPQPRPSYPINSSFPGTDAWASTAAAFAMGSLLYSGITWNTTTNSSSPTSPSLTNTTYSSLLLTHAESLLKTALSNTPFTTYSSSIPSIANAYASSGFADDLCLAALTVAAATNDSDYYSQAYQIYGNYSLSGSQAVWNWDSKVPAVYVLFVEIALARPGLAMGAGLSVNLTGWQNEAEAYFDRIVNQKLKSGYLTRGGLLYYNGDSDDASLNPAIAAATLMLRYAPMASSSSKAESYRSFAMSQVDYLMGKNPMNVVYLVGQHPNSPQNPYSAMASGGTNINDIRNSPPAEAHVLYGAMVGGPLSTDQFWDYRDDWVQSEVALDYNANIATIAAMQLMANASDPYYVQVQVGSYSPPSTQPCDAALPCSSGLSGGAIGGIVAAVIIGILIVACVILWLARRRLRSWWRIRGLK